MKITITDSNGDTISIRIGGNGSFQELNESLEKGKEMQMNFTGNLQNEKRAQSEDQDIPANCSTMEFTVEDSNNSNPQLLEEDVKSWLDQIQIEPDPGSGMRNSDINVSISSENNHVSKSRSLCRLCGTQGDDMVYLFEREEPYSNIIQKMEDLGLPITVTKTDTLPKEACRSCLEKLELCSKFHETVFEAEKRFIILGGRISYNSEKTTKHHQIMSKDGRRRNSSTGDEDEDVNFVETSRSHAMQHNSYSSESRAICPAASGAESSFEGRNSDQKCYEFSNRRRKRAKKNDDIIIEDEVEDGIDVEQSGDPEIIRCRICGWNFQTVKKCYSHSRIHVRENYYPCILCNEVFTIEKDWSEHGIEHTDSRRFDRRGDTNHVCDKCGNKFLSEARLWFHEKYHNPGAKPGYCEICDKNFDLESTLYNHFQTVHERCNKFRVMICGKQIRTQSTINTRQRKNKNVRSFENNMYDERLSLSDPLEINEETDPELLLYDKIFSCAQCGKSFNGKLPLAIHVKSHMDSNFQSNESIKKKKPNKSDKAEQVYKCSVCKKTFNYISKLEEHSRVHTGIKPYRCHLCGKSFKRANTRTVHMLIHTGEKPFKCDVCGINMRRASDLRKHEKTQHGLE